MLCLGGVFHQLCFPSPQTPLFTPVGRGLTPLMMSAMDGRQPQASPEPGKQPVSHCGAPSAIQPGCARHAAASSAAPALRHTSAKSKEPSLSQPQLLQPGTGPIFALLGSNLARTPNCDRVLGSSRAL